MTYREFKELDNHRGHYIRFILNFKSAQHFLKKFLGKDCSIKVSIDRNFEELSELKDYLEQYDILVSNDSLNVTSADYNFNDWVVQGIRAVGTDEYIIILASDVFI